MDVPLWIWAITVAAVLGMLAFDFLGHVRTPHAPSLRESALWSAAYVGIAVVFGLLVLAFAGAGPGGGYFAGYLTEKSLSVDNLFVFVLILAAFGVPRELQQKVLLFGIAIALVAIGSADVLFAVDSIPAIFGVTQHTFLVFAANAFSLLGLRQLFFLVDGLLDRLVHLAYGLAVVLGVIGVKLVIHAPHTNELPFLA